MFVVVKTTNVCCGIGKWNANSWESIKYCFKGHGQYIYCLLGKYHVKIMSTATSYPGQFTSHVGENGPGLGQFCNVIG